MTDKHPEQRLVSITISVLQWEHIAGALRVATRSQDRQDKEDAVIWNELRSR